MILRELENIIEERKKVDEFIYPFYQKYCFSNIPSTILELFNIQTRKLTLPSELHRSKVELENCNKIVVLLVDGFGYNHWLKCYREFEFFNTVSQKGVLSPITTIFPSTTAATITTMNTGLTPQEHALPEWTVYFKEIDMIINTLPFTPLGKKGQDSLLEMGVNPKILYEGNTLHQTLKEEGIKSFSFIKASNASSCYSKIVLEGSTIIPFLTNSDLVVRLRKLVEDEEGPAYFYVYIDNLDIMEHQYGSNNEEFLAELSILSYLLKRGFLEKIDKKVAKETILLITSDHGHVGISPRDTIYLNRFQELVNAFQMSEKGKPILPTGSPRDVFLHVKPSKLEGIQSFLSNRLKGKAKVMKTKEAIKMGLFGTGKPVEKFLDRVGDLLILPHNNHTVWYEHIKGEKFHALGYHGGLTKDEMLVPFAIAKLCELL